MRKLPGEELDRHLRQAMAGEPPTEAEARLRAGMREAWRRVVAAERAEGVGSLDESPWWLARRSALLPAAAALMLAVGAALQVAAPPRALADSLSRRARTSRLARALEGASAMACTVGVRKGPQPGSAYRIDWRADGPTNIVLEGGTEPARWEVAPPASRTTLLDGPPPAEPAFRLDDPRLRPVASLLSPAAVLRLVASADRAAPLSVEVDATTGLPVVLATAEWTARCEWTLAEARPTLLGVAAPPAPRRLQPREGERHDD